MDQPNLNAITGRVIECALRVHEALGPGLLESAYDACMTFELLESGLHFDRQKAQPSAYSGQRIDCGYRIDFLVENEVIVELKAIERVLKVHEAQLLSYLKLSKRTVGLLFNFNVKWLTKEGLKRVVNGFADADDRGPEMQARRLVHGK